MTIDVVVNGLSFIIKDVIIMHVFFLVIPEDILTNNRVAEL